MVLASFVISFMGQARFICGCMKICNILFNIFNDKIMEENNLAICPDLEKKT